ncbi:MAG TPA: GatB/YqeY domain-containing protein [Rhodanobacteraceae bacterium]
MAENLKQRLTDDMKAAMRSGDKPRLGTIRLINAAIKQREVDERITLDDGQVLAILEKMLKQRRDSIQQYEAAKREDLASAERAEMTVIEGYMPAQLDDAALDAMLDAAIAETGAASMRDMGRVMGYLKQHAAGQADMGQLSAKVKVRLA